MQDVIDHPPLQLPAKFGACCATNLQRSIAPRRTCGGRGTTARAWRAAGADAALPAARRARTEEAAAAAVERALAGVLFSCARRALYIRLPERRTSTLFLKKFSNTHQ